MLYKTAEEAAVHKEFAKYANVVEAWPLYDSIVISRQFYGNEQGVDGWYTSFANFGAQETHKFFKVRTDSVGQAYCNMQSADSMDFAFRLHSVGLAIWSPAPNMEGVVNVQDTDGVVQTIFGNDQAIGHWFAAELPNHLSISLKVQQDIKIELPGMGCPPGYGPIASGTANQLVDDPDYGEIPYNINSVVQGVPILENRYPLPTPIGIPRTASIEGRLTLSETARSVLQAVTGPQDFWFNSTDGLPAYTFFPKRYIITFSLFGERMIQQRGEYHR